MKLLLKIENRCLKMVRDHIVRPTKKNHATCPADFANEFIKQGLLGENPFMVARYGSCEFDAMTYPYVLGLPIRVRYKLFVKGLITYVHRDDVFVDRFLKLLCNNAGFFPYDECLVDKYSRLMLGSSESVDLLGTWNWIPDLIYKQQLKGSRFVQADFLEPYDFEHPWTKALEGKKVLVIHPFAKTIECQYKRRELLWENQAILPAFELKTIKAVQTIAGEKSEFESWFDALEWMENEIDKIDFDIAIIGCGAYGFPLAAYCKKNGKKAIHLGGATQILFGIRGKRWEELPEVAKFMNEYWVRPLPEETPQAKQTVEGGCYW